MKVSIICSVYNREKYIRQCVDSILKQSIEDFELILIDNGCSDACPAIIDEYASKDSRVVALHNEAGSTYGKALNQGIAMAKGEYIGIVESDDFTHKTMYERLYNKAIEFDADVVIAGFYIHIQSGTHENHVHNQQIFSNVQDDKLFSISDYPFLFTCHPSIWSKLYRSSFLKNIKFDENGRYIDSKFIVDLYCSTNKIIALKEPVYYYNNDNPDASQSNSRKDASLSIICDDWMKAKEQLKAYGRYEDLKEAFWFQVSKATFRFYANTHIKYKKEFFKKIKMLFSELKEDDSFKFKYFDENRKSFLKKVLANKFEETIYDKYKSKKIFGYTVYEKAVAQGKEKKKLFGITIKSKSKEKTKYLGGLFSKKTKNGKKSYRVLGIKVYSKNTRRGSLYEIREDISRIEAKINACLNQSYNIATVVQACQVNKKTFEQYKGAFRGKKVVLVGCGPSLSQYSPMENVIHIGVNRAFKYEKIKFDYLFVQDQFPEGMDEVNAYRQGECQKFYGILPPQRSRQVYPMVKRVPPAECLKAGALPYIIQDTPNLDIAYDLACEPIGDFQGCVFSALQFLMYAHPEEIYLVGFDCSEGHFYGDKHSNLSYQKKSWCRFRDVFTDLYPDIKLYSVNPVGLRGIFNDIDMELSMPETFEEYVKENITPIFSEKFCTIAMSSSDEYVPYLSVCLKSILNVAKDDYNYDIIIFERSITEQNKNILKKQIKRKNISIRFVNPINVIKSFNLKYPDHYNLECYFRLASPIIMKNYEKYIFTDVDLIFMKDPYDLYVIELDNYPIGVCKDLMFGAFLKYEKSDWMSYARNTLQLNSPFEYFNTGVMLINNKIFNENNYSYKILNTVSNTFFRILEQDGLNYFFKNNVKYIETSWNYPVESSNYKEVITCMPEDMKFQYAKDKKNPAIIHFAGKCKPWRFLDEEFAYLWWEIARETPFYEEILTRLHNINKLRNEFTSESYNIKLSYVLNHLFNYKLKLLRYRLLKHISSEKRKVTYQLKYKAVSQLIRDAKQLRKQWTKF